MWGHFPVLVVLVVLDLLLVLVGVLVAVLVGTQPTAVLLVLDLVGTSRVGIPTYIVVAFSVSSVWGHFPVLVVIVRIARAFAAPGKTIQRRSGFSCRLHAARA